MANEITNKITNKITDDFDDEIASEITNEITEDFEIDDATTLIASNRTRRDIARKNSSPRDKSLSGAVKEMLRDAAKAEAQVDVFNPTFKGKQFEENWLLESLGGFYSNHLIADILSQVKGGKEANVYCCSAHAQLGIELVAAKVYRPRMFRNLKNDAAYRAGGNLIGDDGKSMFKSREQRAVAKRSKVGLQMLHGSWLQNEYGALNQLHAAGAHVPRTYGVHENAILMTYLGEREMAAVPLAQVHLERDEALPLFHSIVEDIRVMLANDLVHGDLSAYNILYWQGEYLIIDFPQAVNRWKNPNAREFFDRDVLRVCEYFATCGVHGDPMRLANSLWEDALGAL